MQDEVADSLLRHYDSSSPAPVKIRRQQIELWIRDEERLQYTPHFPLVV